MRGYIFAAAALIGGCATTLNTVRELPPKATYQSPKSGGALQECIAGALSVFGGPSVVQGEHRTTLAFGSGGVTSYVIEIEPPSVTIRSGYPYSGAIKRRIEACL